jgi:hypothetical protein
MGNLALTLSAMGDHQGAKKLFEQVIELSNKILGPEHSDTTLSAWNLYCTLSDIDETIDALNIVSEYLFWLLGDEVVLFNDYQMQIKERNALV